MKRKSKQILSLLLTVAVLCTMIIAVPITASAAESPLALEGSGIEIWADSEGVLSQTDVTDFTDNGSTLSMLGGIQPHKRSTSSSNYYWFLPSTADCSALTFWFDGTATIDGTEITSGTATDVFADINEGGVSKTVSLVLNDTTYSVLVIKSGDVGTVYIDTDSGSLETITNSDDHSTYEAGTIMVVQADGTVDYCGVMSKMSGRGNGTWDVDNVKNPYNIKLSSSASLLGMGSAKKWCLLANVNDSSLVKNQLTYDFAKYIGINYQPVCKPVDLYVNQQYLGSYQLSEKVEIKSNRINISDAYENLEIANGTTDETTGAIIPADLEGTEVTTTGTSSSSSSLGSSLTSSTAGHTVGAMRYSPSLTDPTDYTGGYVYELEISNRWVDENAGFCAYNRQGWVIKSADYASTSMAEYSYNLLYALGSAVYNDGTVPSESTTTNCSSLTSTLLYGAKSITNPAPETEYQGMSWSDLLDSDSAVRYYWTQEFFKNMDSSTSSTYFYKESDSIDSMLYAGPVWDMDNSIGYGLSGSRWGYSWTSSDGWYTKNTRIYRWRSSDSSTSYSSDSYAPLSFYGALATNCSDFWETAEKYWYNYISPAVDIITGNAVDSTGTLKSASEYIETVAKSGLMNAIRLNLDDDTYDYESHITSMTEWFTERQTWINEEIPQSDISSVTVASTTDKYYTSYEITPEPKVSTFISGTGTVTLEEGLDYTYSYDDNVNVGTATINVNGIGIYTGTATKTFNIIKTNMSTCTVTIDETAYSGTTLTAETTISDGRELQDSHTYQWYRDGVAISDATEQTYIATDEDIGTTLTVVATGDDVNMTGSQTSNECTVVEGSASTSYTRTIASWDYDYTADSTTLTNADTTGEGYYYTATSGENQSTSNLYASVDAVNPAKVKWSGTSDLYTNSSNTVESDQAPVMGTSKTDLLAWGTYPYFETVLSTAGYENIKFSAKLGGTKKAPSTWKLQYSLDGETYTDVGSTYTIQDNKTMELAFDDISLPDEVNNQKTVYIRMVVCEDIAINGTSTIVDQVSGDAAVNNIKVTGTSLTAVTSLYAPTVTPEEDSSIFSDDSITIADNNGGADVYYTVNGSDATLYTGAFNPFDETTAKIGDTAVITAYSQYEDIVSDEVTVTYTFAGVNINSFSYTTYSDNVANGAVASTGGVYDESGKMTTYTDGNSQYVPLWDESNGAFKIAPDDGAVWTEDSGFTFKTSTAGYENVAFSCKAYTTTQGPNSVTLQYSTDGITYYNIESNVQLSANSALEQLFLAASLPAACDNQQTLYIRLVTTEDLTFGGTTLHNNESKGNLYLNDIVISGEDNGDYKMPYTNKSTCYFGSSGVIKYYSPDNMAMSYAVVDSSNTIVANGTYPSTGIQLSSVSGFDVTKQDGYTVLVWVEEDEETSLVNRATYYYKGDTVVKFNYNDTTKLYSDYVSADFTEMSSTSGANSGTLSMYPDAVSNAVFTYTGTYGIKVTYDSTMPYAATKDLDNPEGNGYWLIKTSTLGYRNLTINLEQLSSNKGPRDWGMAYSTDGENYTYIDSSNVRAISNDAASSTVETYTNLALPSECSNQETLYIKIFINGGESVDGTELESVTKGNTGINAVEISGTVIPSTVTLTTTVLEDVTDDTGSISFSDVDVYVDGTLKGTTDENGQITLSLAKNTDYTVKLSGDGIVTRTLTVNVDGDSDVNVPVLVFDVNGDGYINAKDYAVIAKDSKYTTCKSYFENFINVKTSEFSY